MAGRTYRNGARRNRRKPDPGKAPPSYPGILNMSVAAADQGGGECEIECGVYFPESITPITSGYLRETGQASTMKVYNAAGDLVAHTISPAIDVEELVWTIGGLSAGLHTFVGGAWDPSLRGINGEWLPTFRVQATVTA